MNNVEPLWTKNFITAGMVSFFQSVVFYMLLVVIAGYAVHELNATTTQAGIITGLFIVGMLAGRLLVNKIVDWAGRSLTLWTAAIGFMLCCGLYFFSSSIESLTVVRFIHGLGYGIINSIMGTMIAQIIPPTRRAEGVGFYSLSMTLGTALGPFLGIFLVLHASYQAIFIAAMIASLLSCLVCLGLKIPALPKKKTVQINPQKSSALSKLVEPAVFPISLIILICAVCYASVLSFITFYAQALDLQQAATVFFLVYAIAVLCSRPFTGKWMDRYGENVVMYPALLALALGFLVLAFTQSSTQLLISAALFGFGFGNIQSIGQTIAIKTVPLERMGLATSTFFIALDAGFGFGPFLLGSLLMVLSYSQMYVFAGILTLFSLVLYFLLHGRKVNHLALKNT